MDANKIELGFADARDTRHRQITKKLQLAGLLEVGMVSKVLIQDYRIIITYGLFFMAVVVSIDRRGPRFRLYVSDM